MFSDIAINIEIFKFQYKVFAMLFSSFENIFFLDADNIAVLNPDDLFTSAPFIEHGMVLWKDFWIETISPIYFNIISKTIPPNLTHMSCEAGQLILSKDKHAKTLLLATYYNVYGPGHYYRLFSQNNHGEGDKETFYMAAEFYNLSYYILNTSVGQMNFYKRGNYDFLAMLQPHPGDDWKKYIKNDTDIKVRWLFIHANYPKLDIVNTISKSNGMAVAEDGSLTRVWASKEVMVREFGYDVEERLWKEVIIITKDLYPDFISEVEQYYRVVIEETQIQPHVKRRRIIMATLSLVALTLVVLIYKFKHQIANRIKKKTVD